MFNAYRPFGAPKLNSPETKEEQVRRPSFEGNTTLKRQFRAAAGDQAYKFAALVESLQNLQNSEGLNALADAAAESGVETTGSPEKMPALDSELD